MKIEVSDYDSPHTLRALAALLVTLADAPRFEKGCAEPRDTPEPDPVYGRAAPAADEPFDIFPDEVAAPSTQRIIGTPFVGNHEARIQTAPMPPLETQFISPHSSPQAGMPAELALTQFVPPTPAAPITFEGFGLHLTQVPPATAPSIAAPAATDKTGLPWDARIHSSSKALVADGTWRLKKGVDKSLVESVTRELRTPRMAHCVAMNEVCAPVEDAHALRVLDATLVPPSPFTVNPAPHAAAPAAGAVTFSGVAGAVPPPPLGAAPLPPAPPLPFNEIMRFFAVHSMAGKLTHADMEAMAKHSGVELTQELINAANAAKRPAALAYLQSLVDARS